MKKFIEKYYFNPIIIFCSLLVWGFVGLNAIFGIISFLAWDMGIFEMVYTPRFGYPLIRIMLFAITMFTIIIYNEHKKENEKL